MSISPEFDKIVGSEAVIVTASNGIECKMPLTEEEFKEILSSNVLVSLTQVDSYNKQIKYSGRAIFTVTYKVDGVIKKQEAGVEFSFKCDFEKCLEGMICLPSIKGENVKVNYQNGIAMASAVIIFNGEISKPYDLNYFVGAKNVITKSEDISYSYEVLKIKREIKIEDEFDLDILVGDVLCHNEKVYLKGCECGIGVIIVEGEVELSSLISPLESGKEPVSTQKTLPFKMELECQDAIPEYLACAYPSIKNSNIKVFVDEAKNKSAVSVEIIVDVCAKVYGYNTFSPVVDAYSNEFELKLTSDTQKLDKVLSFNTFEDRIKSEISFNAPENARLIGVINDKIEEIKYSLVNDEMLIEGVLSVTALYYGDNFTALTALVPFTSKVKLNGNNFAFNYSEVVDVKTNGSMVEFTLKVCYLDIFNHSFKVISEATEGAKKRENTSAISVYIASQGDTLWDVSKTLGVKEEDILKTNEGLSFPLESSERIIVYREK